MLGLFLFPLLGASRAAELPPLYWKGWLQEVDLLLLPREREAFERLATDSERWRFVDAFWRSRDAVPETPLNEARERWEWRVRAAVERFPDLTDERARLALLLGPVSVGLGVACKDLVAEMYHWDLSGRGVGAAFISRDGAPFVLERRRAQVVGGFEARGCPQAGEVGRRFEELPGPRALERSVRLPELVDEGWLEDSLPRSAPAAWDVERVRLAVVLGARYADAVAVTFRLRVPRAVLAATRNGERVVPRLDFRATFVGSDRVARLDHHFHLPLREDAADPVELETQRLVALLGPSTLVVDTRDELGDVLLRRAVRVDLPKPQDAEDLAPAPRVQRPADNVAELAQRPRVRLRGPRGAVVGPVEFEAEVAGSGVAAVSFVRDGREVGRVEAPPFRTLIDFGPEAKPGRLFAVALDAGGRELATDSLRVNEGAAPLRVSIGRRVLAPGQSEIALDVHGADDSEIRSVELWRGEERIGARTRPPFSWRLGPSNGARGQYLRATVELADGRRAEDVLLVGVPGAVEHLEVEAVELFATITDEKGRPVLGLDRGDVTVLENGSVQRVREIAALASTPLRIALLLDRSSSMDDAMKAARRSAVAFLEQVMRPQDRTALISFNHEPELVVPLTDDLSRLAGGVAEIDSWGGTALWESVGVALYYLHGLSGRRTIVVLTDGVDEHSAVSYRQLFESAVRSGTIVYAIALGPAARGDAMTPLGDLAEATGGELIRARSADDLAPAYARIREALHSQYRIAYQSSNSGSDFRRVEVRGVRTALRVRTVAGYFP